MDEKWLRMNQNFAMGFRSQLLHGNRQLNGQRFSHCCLVTRLNDSDSESESKFPLLKAFEQFTASAARLTFTDANHVQHYYAPRTGVDYPAGWKDTNVCSFEADFQV